ncbi:hypothetical protein BJ165DRAFT_921885 [Panaeolus papilionaceus]|nr:hypothetical protein BJ165DRAFT_921885 [Panaeolus papilionaceus]
MHILELPVDIWLHLLLSVPTRLKLQDVIALSQTCAELHRTLSNKSVWWSLLKAVCSKDDIYLQSFNKDEMTINDIKRAALAPSRMASILVPVSKYVLPYTPNHNILAMILLPGGRFLIAKTKDEILVIDAQRKAPPLPQTRHKSLGNPRFANWIFLVGPSLDGLKFRIASIEQFSER